MTAVAIDLIDPASTFATAVDAPAVATPPVLCCAECHHPIVGEALMWVNVSTHVGGRVMACVHYRCAITAVRNAIASLTGVAHR